MRRSALLGLAVAVGAFMACPEVMSNDQNAGEIRLPAPTSPPRGGDPVRGRDLVLNNGTVSVPYISCGLPRGVVNMLAVVGIDRIGTGPTLPERKRGMANLPYYISTTTRPNGVDLVTSNCLLCHASKLGDSVIVGLPNSALDLSQDPTIFGLLPLGLDVISLLLTPQEKAELARYRRVSEAAASAPRPDTRGVNSADVMFGIIAAHRDPATLQWNSEADTSARLDKDIAYTDVPAWWNMRFRDRMFYSGVGKGSHARIMMSASLLCLDDSTEASAIDSYFNDIEAFILSLKPPKYTEVAKRPIDGARAARGRSVYTSQLPDQPAGRSCIWCHGDPQNNVPPVSTVPASVVGTDPVYARNASVEGDSAISFYFDFFNSTWFGRAGDRAIVEQTPIPVYSPPPLAGIWATAPYFHNASVPTLEGVLKPSIRPALYRRAFKPEHYDFGGGATPRPPRHNGGVGQVGWPYEPVLGKMWWDPFFGWHNDSTVYDVSRPGYGNQGHTFAAGLTDAQREDLIEYLKTL